MLQIRKILHMTETRRGSKEVPSWSFSIRRNLVKLFPINIHSKIPESHFYWNFHFQIWNILSADYLGFKNISLKWINFASDSALFLCYFKENCTDISLCTRFLSCKTQSKSNTGLKMKLEILRWFLDSVI